MPPHSPPLSGVRYLEKAFLQRDTSQLSLVFHALAERATLLQNAPHLSWPLPTLTPCYSWWELPYYWAGLKAYDLLAGRQVLHSSRSVSPEEASAMIPTLAKKTRGACGRRAVTPLSFCASMRRLSPKAPLSPSQWLSSWSLGLRAEDFELRAFRFRSYDVPVPAGELP